MPAFNPGDRVSQQQYGSGTIQSINDQHIVIDFDEHGVRTFSTPRARLERCDSVAPVKAKKKAVRRKKAEASAEV